MRWSPFPEEPRVYPRYPETIEVLPRGVTGSVVTEFLRATVASVTQPPHQRTVKAGDDRLVPKQPYGAERRFGAKAGAVNLT